MSSPEIQLSRQQQSRSLKEMVFLFQSVYFYLEHLDVRLQYWVNTLTPLLALLPEQQQQLQVLEQELDASSRLLEELKMPLMGTSLEHFQEQAALLETSQDFIQTELQTETQVLKNYFNQLESLETRLIGYSDQLEGLEQEYLNLAQTHLQTKTELQALQETQEKNESYIQAQTLNQIQLEQRLDEEKKFSEAQIESLNEIIEKTAREGLFLQKGHQDAGIALARMAQLKNEAETHSQHLQAHILALESENADLQQQMVNHRDTQPTPQQETAWQMRERINQARYQTCLELFALSKTHPNLNSEDLLPHLQASLQISMPVAEALQARLDANLGHINILLQKHLKQDSQVSSIQKMVTIPAGIYPIGDDFHSAERPAHSLKTEGFQIDPFPVTNSEFATFIAAGAYQNPDFWLPEGWKILQEKAIIAPAFWNVPGHSSGDDYPDYPVIGVSWYEAQAFAHWAGKRLPSEVEWEIACRGVNGLIWPWGNDWEEGKANTAESGLLNLCPVGLYPHGKSPVGCYDMIGQSYEWTSSIYQAYPYQKDASRENLNLPGPRSLRGCSWRARGPYFTRGSYRFFQPPEHRHSDIGFRCAGEQFQNK
jgi:formylglycine-generating enzyme required for sulfatase activity